MPIFQKRATPETLAKAQEALARDEANIAELTAERGRRLTEAATTDVSSIVQIDRRIEQHRLNAVAIRDRITLIEADLREQEIERLKRERAAAIASIEGKLAGRVQPVAAELETALKAVVAVVQKLDGEVRAVCADWPAILQRPQHQREYHQWILSTNSALDCIRKSFAPFVHNSPGWTLETAVAHGVAGFAEAEAKRHATLIADLRDLPLEEPSENSADDESEAA